MVDNAQGWQGVEGRAAPPLAPLCGRPAGDAEAGSDLTGGLLGAERVDVKRVDELHRRQLCRQLDRQLETAAHADLAVSGVRKHAARQAAGALCHALAAEQGDAREEAN